MNTNWNWLQDLHRHAGEPDRAQAMPVFSGQNLVVVGGSSGIGRQTAVDVVAAGGTAVIIGQDPGKVDDTVKTLAKDGKAYGITTDLADREQAERGTPAGGIWAGARATPPTAGPANAVPNDPGGPDDSGVGRRDTS
jgi:NADPH:quinone reductase-like Zn-dependent oxidoreductase